MSLEAVKGRASYSLCFSGMGLSFAWKGLVSNSLGIDEGAVLRLAVPLVAALVWFAFTPAAKRFWLLWGVGAIGFAGTILAWGASSFEVVLPGCFDLGVSLIVTANLLILLLWTDFYSALDVRLASIVIPSAYVLGPTAYFAVRFLPDAFLPGLTLVLPFVSVACLVVSFILVARSAGAALFLDSAVLRRNQGKVRFPWQPVLVVAAFAFAFGINRNYTMVEVDLASQGIAGLVLLVIVSLTPKKFSVYSVYRFALPLMMVGLMVGAFFGGDNFIAQVLINACYAFAAMTLIVILCDKAHRFGLSALRLNGFARVITGAAFLCGGWAEQAARLVLGASVNEAQLVYAVTAVVVAAAALLWFSGRGYIEERINGDRFSEGKNSGEDISADKRSTGNRVSWIEQMDDGDSRESHVAVTESKLYRELVEKRCDELAREYRLSNREAEVLVLLARGWSASRIEKEFTLSNSTVKTHTKHIYAKMGIHSRDELKMLLDIA